MPDTGMTIGLIKALGGGVSEAEVEELRSAIENILVEDSSGETVTLTSNKAASNFYNSSNTALDGLKKSSLTDGVAIYLSNGDTTKTNLGASYGTSSGTKKWICGFKYRLTKVDPNLANPSEVRIYLGSSNYWDNTSYTWGDWIYFAQTLEVNLSRIYIIVRGFDPKPNDGDFKLELKDLYLYDATDVSNDMCEYIMQQQNTNYTSGTVTYSTVHQGYFPDTGLNTEGKAADSKAVGDAISAVKMDVTKYGVKGDGTTDDTDAINYLFTHYTGSFYFPAGTYNITGTISLPSESEMYGDADQTVIDMSSCDNLVEKSFYTGEKVYPYILVEGDNTKLHDFKLIGNSTTQEKRHAGICVLDASNCIVDGVTVLNINYDSTQTEPDANGYGIMVNRSEYVTVQKCNVQNCGYECIGIVYSCNHCTVRDCYTKNGWRTCIQVHYNTCNTVIENNYMLQDHDKYDACFTCHALTDQHIVNLRVIGNTLECTQNGIQGNQYCAPAQFMTYVDYLVFMGNRIFGGKRALYINDSSNNAKIIGNDMQCNDTSDYGVYICSRNTIVVGNCLSNEAETPVNTFNHNPVKSANIGIS